MLVRAKVSFAGALSMYAGEVRECSEEVALPLLECGYLEEISSQQDEYAAKGGKSGESKRNNRK